MDEFLICRKDDNDEKSRKIHPSKGLRQSDQSILHRFGRKSKQKVDVTEFNADIQDELDKIPGAEVAEVVRCGKCRYYAPTIKRCLNFCALDHPKPDDYCSFGERFSNEE